MRRRWLGVPRLVVPLVVAMAAVLGGWVLVEPASGAGALTATFVKTSDWGTGYVADYDIANGGAPIKSWTLSFTLSSGQAMTNSWDGNVTQSGTHYVVTNDSWNGALATGATAQLGFQASYAGSFVAPTDCLINGRPCAGTTTTTTTKPPPTTTTTKPPPTTTTTKPPPTTTTTAPSGGASPVSASFAPYVDATVDYPPFSLVNDEKATGTKFFTLAFIVSEDGCKASWGGYYPVTDGYYESQIQALRAVGGDVIVSFGGEAGEELADACTSVAALEAQYQSVVTEYDLTHIDFDIEGADEGNTTSLDRRFQAIAELEAANPNLSVSLTVPVLPSGLDADGLGVVKAAIAEGARVDLVNVMAMDYGDGDAPDPAGQMGTYAIDAAKATHAQLESLHPSLTSAQVWKMVGVTPLLGVNDVTDEIFEFSDAQQLVAYASEVHMGRISMWAATRDVECPGGAQTYSSDTCSSIVEQPFAFSKIFVAFKG